jgi:hypothetical protein
MKMEEETKIQIEKSSVKLIKNTKGYNWEIRLVEGISRETIDELIGQVFYGNELMINKTSMLI